MHSARLKLIVIAASIAAASCGGGGGGGGVFPILPPAPAPAPPAPPPPPPAPAPEERRAQDDRNSFAPADPTATTFAALAAAAGDTVDNATTSRWAGVLGGAAYRVEVPSNWNGKLVMYAHGYAGEGNVLAVSNPSIRRYLIQNGYAWAASSYSKNFYDVRVGVEDTNALALEFNKIAKANGRELAAPSKIYITGHSMGGHITAAAIEDEAYATANHKVRYNGAVPMCGVVGDTELFDYFAGAQVTAQALAGLPKYPTVNWSDIVAQVTGTLFTDFTVSPIPNITTTPTGTKYASVIENLTGGPRPMFDLGFKSGGSFAYVWGVLGSDGTVNGILNKSTLDTNRFTYTIEGDAGRLDGAQQLGAQAHRRARCQPPAPRRPALDSQGQWRVQDPGGHPAHARRPLRALQHGTDLQQARGGQGQRRLAGAARGARHHPLRLHAGRAGRGLRRDDQVGTRRREARGRRRGDRGDGGRSGLWLQVHSPPGRGGRNQRGLAHRRGGGPSLPALIGQDREPPPQAVPLRLQRFCAL
jgi:hypothetical protein